MSKQGETAACAARGPLAASLARARVNLEREGGGGTRAFRAAAAALMPAGQLIE
jgi:hypothetical protein